MGRLLLIDDGLESDAFRWFLQAKEVEALIVKDPVCGFLRATAERPEIVVVSSTFGLDYIRRIATALRADPAAGDIRLIALLDPQDARDGVNVDAVVIRPFHLEDLYAVILGTADVAPC